MAFHFLIIDNISTIPPWLSNALCRISTGGGLGVRKHYSNDEEILFNVTRPICLNGIDNFITRHDLLDRSIIINLPPISPKNRKTEQEIYQELEKIQPYVLGALLDATCEALKNFPDTKLETLPRMADFALWIAVAEPSLPWSEGKFLESYETNRKKIIKKSLDSDSAANAIFDFMDDRKEWQGTASELLESLNKYIPTTVRRSKSWPKSSNVLTRRINKIKGSLRIENIYIDCGESRTSRKRLIKIVRKNH